MYTNSEFLDLCLILGLTFFKLVESICIAEDVFHKDNGYCMIYLSCLKG